MNQLTKVSLAWELFKSGVPKAYIAQDLEVHRETVHLWVTNIARHPQGLLGFLADYQVAKKGLRAKRKLDGLLKERIYRLREDNRDCCGQKIREFLRNEFGVVLSVPTIYKVLSEKYKLRSKWKKNQVRGPVPEATKPREVVQMDTALVRFLPLPVSTSLLRIALSDCIRISPVPLVPTFSARPWERDSSTPIFSKLKVVRSLRISSAGLSTAIPIGFVSPGHTRRTNKVI